MKALPLLNTNAIAWEQTTDDGFVTMRAEVNCPCGCTQTAFRIFFFQNCFCVSTVWSPTMFADDEYQDLYSAWQAATRAIESEMRAINKHLAVVNHLNSKRKDCGCCGINDSDIRCTKCGNEYECASAFNRHQHKK